MSNLRGRFTRFDAEVVIGETLDTTTVTATIDVASIDTATADRDAHVLSPHIIDVAKAAGPSWRKGQNGEIPRRRGSDEQPGD